MVVVNFLKILRKCFPLRKIQKVSFLPILNFLWHYIAWIQTLHNINAPVSFYKSLINDWKWRAFRNYWTSLTTARQSRNPIRINKKNSKFFISLSRNNIRKITGVLTGHCKLNKYMHTIGLAINPFCDKCGDVETAEHFLCVQHISD